MAELPEAVEVVEEPSLEGGEVEDLERLSPFDRPFPGQGIADNNKSYPHNRPPEFTNYDKAQTYIFDNLTSRSERVIDVLHDGATVEDITEMVLNHGYIEGKWDHNLLMLLAEPTIYIILFIAEISGVDYILYDDEVDDMTNAGTQMQAENHLTQALQSTAKKAEKDIASKGAEESIAAALPPSLLERGS